MVRRIWTAALLLVGSAAIFSAGCGGGVDGAGATTIVIRYSGFEPATMTAQAGMPLTVTIRNDDPIAHEWMAGDAATQARHRTGTEPFHDQIPTEVTIPAFSSRTTTIMFDEPGTYLYVCHLPGHEAYGMVGVLTVTEGLTGAVGAGYHHRGTEAQKEARKVGGWGSPPNDALTSADFLSPTALPPRDMQAGVPALRGRGFADLFVLAREI